MKRSTSLVFLVVAACGRAESTCPIVDPVPTDEHLATLDALAPPKRTRPVVAVIGAADGTETTDYLVPLTILARSGAADVVALSTERGPMSMMPALSIDIQHTLGDFEAMFPDGADYVVIPALHHPDDPDVLAFVRAQYDGGATVVGVCSGARVLALAGLLADRDATGHWYDRDWLEHHEPTLRWVEDRRYVVDRGVVTTTGVTASMPVSLALVEAIAGTDRAAALADELGVDRWDAGHDSAAFADGQGYVGLVVGHTLAFWSHDTIAIPVEDGVDDLALALASDAWSRTYRSHAEVVSEDGSVTTAGGLTVYADREDVGHAFSWPLPDAPATEVLDQALDGIDERYGSRTAGWVARQLEYPGWCAE